VTAVVGGRPRDDDDVAQARRDLLVAPGAAVGLDRLERMQEAHLDGFF